MNLILASLWGYNRLQRLVGLIPLPFLCFFRIVLAILAYLLFHLNFRISLPSFKTSCWYFYWD